jgi:hypothetical protein
MVFRALDLWKLGEPGPPASTYWSSQPFWNQIINIPASRAAVTAVLMFSITSRVAETSNPARSR